MSSAQLGETLVHQDDMLRVDTKTSPPHPARDMFLEGRSGGVEAGN